MTKSDLPDSQRAMNLRIPRCPFCDSYQVAVTTGLDNKTWFVFCEDCGCQGPWGSTCDKAVKAWSKALRRTLKAKGVTKP